MAALLEVDALKIDARKDDGSLAPIVKRVSFEVKRGQVLALIGESGSGKTTIALSALGYTKPGLEFTGGEVRLDGEDVIAMPAEDKRQLRGERVAYLAQSAAATFNPVKDRRLRHLFADRERGQRTRGTRRICHRNLQWISSSSCVGNLRDGLQIRYSWVRIPSPPFRNAYASFAHLCPFAGPSTPR